MQPPLSLCMLVKDEERNLPKCLDCVRALEPEIVIADTGSTDRTIEIAQQYGARVFSFSFERVDFAAARNQTLARAAGRWILMLDADEVLEPAGAPLMQSLIAGSENAGYYFARRNHASDAEGFTTDYAVRLFPNRPDYRYRGRVHETVDAAILAAGGRLLNSGIVIDHNFVSDREARRRKNQRYIEILKEEIEADPSDSTRLDFLAAEFHQLEMFAEAALVAEEIVRMRPLDANAHLNLGIYRLVWQSDPERARASFEQALGLRPGYPEALSFLQTAGSFLAAAPRPGLGPSAAMLRTMSNEAGAPRKVFCVKLKRELEGLAEIPFEGHPLGQRIYDNVSKQAWGMWVEHMKMLMNEYRLNLGTQQAQEFLLQQMEQYFFGEGSAPPPEYVASTPQS